MLTYIYLVSSIRYHYFSKYHITTRNSSIATTLVLYLLFTRSGWRAVKCDELLQLFFQAGLRSVPLGRLRSSEISPELRLTPQQTITLVSPGDKLVFNLACDEFAECEYNMNTLTVMFQ